MTKQEAVRFFGTQHALAKALNLKQPSVANWGEYPPPLRQLQIEMLTMGALRAEPSARPPAPIPQQAAAGCKKQMG